MAIRILGGIRVALFLSKHSNLNASSVQSRTASGRDDVREDHNCNRHQHNANMAGFFTWLWDWLLWAFWATEMDVTIVGLQNAGKTSLLRVLAVSTDACLLTPTLNGVHAGRRIHHRLGADSSFQQKGSQKGPCQYQVLGSRRSAAVPVYVGAILPRRQCHHLCRRRRR